MEAIEFIFEFMTGHSDGNSVQDQDWYVLRERKGSEKNRKILISRQQTVTESLNISIDSFPKVCVDNAESVLKQLTIL